MSVDLNPKLFTQLALDLNSTPLEGFPEHFFILDCETTGGRPTRDRMTELAWIEIKDGRIVSHWQSLFDPEIPVPPWIRKLTGISDHMLESAPTFKSQADFIYEQLNGQVVVAHNARFDYGFLKNEFKRLKQTFSAKTLCSVKLSRSMFPHLKGHGLDKIIKRCEIELECRHRAMTDVLAVLAFFQRITIDEATDRIAAHCNQLLKKPSLPSHLNQSEVERIPHSAGVYYFFDNDDRLLYVGKSVDLKARVMSHFTQDHMSATDAKVSQSIHSIDFQVTPTDFGAQLLESMEIKRLSPAYNQRLRRTSKLYHIVVEENQQGYLRPVIRTATPENHTADTYGLYRSQFKAKNRLRRIAADFNMCLQLLGLEAASNGPCFGYQLQQCNGACCGEESAEEHNHNLLEALEQYKTVDWPWQGPILVTESSDEHEYTVSHLIDQWCYLGIVQSMADIGSRSVVLEEQFDLDIYHILVKFLFPDSKGKPASSQIQVQTLDGPIQLGMSDFEVA